MLEPGSFATSRRIPSLEWEPERALADAVDVRCSEFGREGCSFRIGPSEQPTTAVLRFRNYIRAVLDRRGDDFIRRLPSFLRPQVVGYLSKYEGRVAEFCSSVDQSLDQDFVAACDDVFAQTLADGDGRRLRLERFARWGNELQQVVSSSANRAAVGDLAVAAAPIPQAVASGR